MHILLADDHGLVREGLRFFFQRLGPGVVVTEAGTLDEALAAVDEPVAFDLIILDLMMPGMRGLLGLDLMRARRPEVPTAILSGSIRREDAVEALSRGAAGFIPKTLGGEALVSALRLMLSGERYLPSFVVREAASPRRESAPNSSVPENALALLSRREREVLALLVEGHPNKEIARRLDLQEVTVKLHLKGIFRKLGAINRTHAVTTALQLGWSGNASDGQSTLPSGQ